MSLIADFQERVLPVKHKLYRFAYRLLGNGQEAEDVVQEVMIKIWTRRQEMHTYINMEAWCMRLTRNLSLDLIRSKKRKFTESLPERLDFVAPDPNPEKLAISQDTLDWVNDIIEQLPEKQKMVIQLRDVEGYSYKEIADILEISLDQVKVNLFRARKKVKVSLREAKMY